MQHNLITQADGGWVYPITNTLFDYFPGAGYDGWCRFRKIKGRVIHIAGKKYAEKELANLTVSPKE